MTDGAGRKSSGFTLLELFGALLVLTTLAVMLVPALAQSREQARRSSCMTNLMQISTALHIYAYENGGRMPWSGGANSARCLDVLVEDGLDVNVFVCPSDPGGMQPQQDQDPALWEWPLLDAVNAGLRSSYDYFGAYTHAPVALPPPERAIPRIPLMWDLTFGEGDYSSVTNHVPGGGNVLWLDGSIEFLVEDDWAAPNLPHVPSGIGFQKPTSEPPANPDDPFFNSLPPAGGLMGDRGEEGRACEPDATA
jgi:prepilin-type processing-associated H-X9-DG protein